MSWKAPALQHRAAQVQRRRASLHHHLRSPVLTDVAVGPRRRWPDERPADRQHHRLPPHHPADARARRQAGARHRRRSPTRRPTPANARQERRRGPCSTWRRSSGTYSLRPMPHARAGPTTSRSCRAVVRWARTSPGGSEGRQFPNETDQIAFVHDGSDQGKRYGQQGQGTGRMPGFGETLLAGPDRGSRRSTSGASDGNDAGVFVHAARSGWQPEIRGIVVVLIAVGVLMGSVYLLLAHEPRRSPRAARGARRALRLAHDPGVRCGGSTASA